AIAIVSVLLAPGRTCQTVSHALQTIQSVVVVLLREIGRQIPVAIRNPVLLLFQISVVVGHVLTRACARTVIAVAIDDRPTIPGSVGCSGITRALTNFRQLVARVVKELVVDWRGGSAELFFRHAAKGRIDDAR